MNTREHASRTQDTSKTRGTAVQPASQKSLLVKAIKRYNKVGWALFHLPRGSKIPEGGSHGFKDATHDRRQIIEVAKREGGNLAVATGSASGVFVIDVDLHKDSVDGHKSLKALERKYGKLPQTFTVKTPNNGRHLYFRWKKGVGKRESVRPGIDVRGEGAYAVLPPSKFNGRRYRIIDDTDVAEAPSWLIKVITTKGKSAKSEKRGGKLRVGGRNDALFRRASSMARAGFSKSAMAAAIKQENSANTEAALPDTEIDKIVESASRYLTDKASEPSTSTLEELLNEEIPPVRWIVRGLLPEGIGLLAGPPKTGKSWLVLQLACAIGAGQALWAGRESEKVGEVLYLALEDNKRRLSARMRKLAGAKAAASKLHYELKWPRLDDGGIEALDSWLQEHPKTRLVIIDTLERVRPKRGGKTSSAYAQDYDVSIRLKPLIDRHRIAVLLVHHTRKEKAEDVMDTISGTHGLSGGLDSLWILRRKRVEPAGTLFISGRDVEEHALTMSFNGCTWESSGKHVESPHSKAREKILMWLRSNGASPPDQISKGVGSKSGNVRVLLKKMLKDEQVSKKGGKYTHTL